MYTYKISDEVAEALFNSLPVEDMNSILDELNSLKENPFEKLILTNRPKSLGTYYLDVGDHSLTIEVNKRKEIISVMRIYERSLFYIFLNPIH